MWLNAYRQQRLGWNIACFCRRSANPGLTLFRLPQSALVERTRAACGKLRNEAEMATVLCRAKAV
jgi:hypothetical protein